MQILTDWEVVVQKIINEQEEDMMLSVDDKERSSKLLKNIPKYFPYIHQHHLFNYLIREIIIKKINKYFLMWYHKYRDEFGYYLNER